MAETLRRPVKHTGYDKKISEKLTIEKRKSVEQRPKKAETKTDKPRKSLDTASNKPVLPNMPTNILSTLEKMRDGGALPNDPEKIRSLISRTVSEMEGLKIELGAKKEEIQQLRSKVVELRHDLSGVNTSKSVLNEYCVTGMVDCMTLNNQINQLKLEKGNLERANEQLKREANEHDLERRGLLNLIDEGKSRQKEFEKLFEAEVVRKKDAEASKIAIMERLGLELKWVRRELEEKTLRLKKLARTNAKLACKLLTLEVDNSEARGIANLLQRHNKQLEGDNQELSGCVIQLENQIDKLSYERQEDDQNFTEMQKEQASHLEEERARLVSKIRAIESSMSRVELRLDENPLYEEEIERMAEEKLKLEWRVEEITHGLEMLKTDKEHQEATMEKARQEHVQELQDESRTLKNRVDELEMLIEASKARELEKLTSHQQALARIAKLEAEKRNYEETIESLSFKLEHIGSEMEAKYSGMQREREMQVAEFGDRRKGMEDQIRDLEACLKEYEAVKIDSDGMMRKLSKDLRECEQEREMLSKQVNVLEWHLTDIYREKMDALENLEDKDMEIMHLTQELANKEEDYERMKKEILQENEDLQMQLHEMQIAGTQALESLASYKRRSVALEQEAERLQKEKVSTDDLIKKMKNKKPWFAFSVQFKF